MFLPLCDVPGYHPFFVPPGRHLPYPDDTPCSPRSVCRTPGVRKLPCDECPAAGQILPQIISDSVSLQFDKDDVRIRISDVFADVNMPFHPDNASRLDVNLLLLTVRKGQTPPEG
jgi:hypothetical protein